MKYSAKDIENIIYRYLPPEEGYQQDVIKAMNYAYKAGGKRLRPMMMLICYRMFAGDEKDEVLERFMSAIEMIHTYSLIHDDLPALDNDELRRGMPTVHKAFGEDIAILAGDGLLNYAYELAASSFSLRPGDVRIEKAMMILATKPGIYGMIGGQTLDVIMSGKEVDEKQLEYIYVNKTSALIECAMMIGAVLGGADDKSVQDICMVARDVGMAFQVQDDILDIVGDEAKLGKPVLSDEKNDKYTYATIHGLKKAREYVADTSKHACNILDAIPGLVSEYKDELGELISMLIDRDR